MRRTFHLIYFYLAFLTFAQVLADDVSDTTKAEEIESMLTIKYASIPVDNQAKALDFYTNTLGFIKKSDIPFGSYRWLTVFSANDPDGAELALEPNDNPAVKTFQKSIFDQGIPATAFVVKDIELSYSKLLELGVKFNSAPKKVGTSTVAVFHDTCGNLIMIAQED